MKPNPRLYVMRARLCASVLLALLLGGLVEVHHHSLVLSRDSDAATRSSFAPSAAHPNQPCHFEEGGETETPHCAACLHNLLGRALLTSLAPTQQIVARGEHLSLVSDQAPSDPCARWTCGRSPPLV